MGNASAVFAALGAFFCCWRHLPGEGARALAAAPSCALLLLLQGGDGLGKAVPVGSLSASWAGSAVFYILLKVCISTYVGVFRRAVLFLQFLFFKVRCCCLFTSIKIGGARTIRALPDPFVCRFVFDDA